MDDHAELLNLDGFDSIAEVSEQESSMETVEAPPV